MILQCAECAKKNRVPAARIQDEPRCGHCGATLPTTGRTVNVDVRAFDDLINNSPLPVVVDFWAPWCGPCRQVAPEVEKLAQNLEGKALVAKLNTEDHPEVAWKEGVRGIPMFVLYRNGERVATQTGAMSADELARNLNL